jgi:hypothetical protein
MGQLAAGILLSNNTIGAEEPMKTMEMKMPTYPGERYEDTVPDTIDIAESARLAINVLTGSLDPNMDYDLYFSVNVGANPPVMTHGFGDWCQPKFMEALPLMRTITGSDQNSQVDQVWREMILKSLGPDGLFYISLKGRPWLRNSDRGPVRVWRADGTSIPFSDPALEQFCAPWNTMRVLSVMTIYHMQDQDPMWRKACEKMIDRLLEAAIKSDDAAYFTLDFLMPFGKLPQDAPPPTGVWSIDNVCRVAHDCGHFYRLTQYPNARILGEKIVNFVRKQSQYFGPDGEWLVDQLDPKIFPGREKDTHFGTHSHGLNYLIDFANATDNAELRNYVRKSFEWALNRNGAVAGQSRTANRMGFFLEYLNDNYRHGETCGVADMIAVAIKLTEGRAGDYWDEVDGWVRNHFISNQITDPTPLMKGKTVSTTPDQKGQASTTYKVVERNVGAFLGWPSACNGNSQIMHCCTGNGSRTLYYIWESMLQCNDGRLRVNLLMNRASAWGDIYSYVPYQGRVELKVKQALKEASFRAPSWIKSGDLELKCTVNGQAQKIVWEGRYVTTGGLKAGDKVTLEFPITETTLKKAAQGQPRETLLGGVEYDQIVFKGSTVVNMQPGGQPESVHGVSLTPSYPKYQRDDYRQSEPKMKKVQRFVPRESFYW